MILTLHTQQINKLCLKFQFLGLACMITVMFILFLKEPVQFIETQMQRGAIYNYYSKSLYHLIVNNTFPENAQDLDLIMTIYNLLQNSKNYPKISVILWNC